MTLDSGNSERESSAEWSHESEIIVDKPTARIITKRISKGYLGACAGHKGTVKVWLTTVMSKSKIHAIKRAHRDPQHFHTGCLDRDKFEKLTSQSE